MSVESPDALIHDTPGDIFFLKKEVPRKRSKVSRACDACRRKKIRCNAEYSSTLLRVTKMCTNCTKTGETCLFSRVPLKRGPSKGYIRELVDHMDVHGHDFHSVSHAQGYRPRSKSIDAAGLKLFSNSGQSIEEYMTSSQSPIPRDVASVKPQLFQKPQISRTPSVTQPIILPPIVGTRPSNHPIKLSLPIPKYKAPVSPLSGGASLQNVQSMLPSANFNENVDHRIQGPLWKVPYEMPASSTPRSNLSPQGCSNDGVIESRRSSVDSVSSLSSSGSASKCHSFDQQTSLDSNSVNYSSEMDLDAGDSETASPPNSVSSLSSLNGKVANHLVISHEGKPSQSSQSLSPAYDQTPMPPFQPPVHFFPHPSQQLQQNMATAQFEAQKFPCQVGPSLKIPLQSINGPNLFNTFPYNLRLYYESIHTGFPILPFDENLIPAMISTLQHSSSPHTNVIPFFLSSLENLINHQIIPFEAIRGMLLQFTSIYPFGNNSSHFQNEVLYLLFSSLLMINYTILLRGESCSTGISLAIGTFTDFKIFQSFKLLSSANLLELGCDDIQLYLPRLLLCLGIIDNCHALSFGLQPQLCNLSEFLVNKLLPKLPQERYCGDFFENVKLGKLFEVSVSLKTEEIYGERPRSKRGPRFSSLESFATESNLASRMFCLQKDKYELFDFAIEVSNFFKSHSATDFDDDYTKDHLHDYQLKTSRLAKKLSQSILSFANYLSSMRLQSKGLTTLSKAEQISPFLNIGYGQALRLIKIVKSLVDSLVENGRDNEITSRAIKIINDLSIATNLLIGTLNQHPENPKNAHMYKKPNNSSEEPANFSGYSMMIGPGISAIKVICQKLQNYDLNFKSNIRLQSDISEQKCFEAWKNNFMHTTNSLILCEDFDGWV